MNFDLLLTVHLGIFISVINQLDAQNFCFTISLWYHHTCRCDDTRGCVIQFWPPDDEHMCSKHVEAWNKLTVKQKFSVLSQPVQETATRRCDDTRGCVMQFWPPDDEHMCSKHVEAWNKLTVKQKFSVLSQPVQETATRRCDDTRGCVMQF